MMLGDLLYADKSKPRVAESEWRELVHAIGRADQFALRALYERTHRLVFTLIVRATHDSAIAADATVDVFCDVWRSAPQFHSLDESVLGWVMNLARCHAVDPSREHSGDRVRTDRRACAAELAPERPHGPHRRGPLVPRRERSRDRPRPRPVGVFLIGSGTLNRSGYSFGGHHRERRLGHHGERRPGTSPGETPGIPPGLGAQNTPGTGKSPGSRRRFPMARRRR